MDIKIIATGSSGNCYLVGDGSTRLLLDAGIPLKRISEGCDYKLSEISAALITHKHKDHSRAIDALIRRGIPCYAPKDMLDWWPNIRPVEKYMTMKERLYNFDVGTFDIQAFYVPHDCDCIGYYIRSIKTEERLVYLTDLSAIPYKFLKVNYWLIEANYSRAILDKNVENGAEISYANRIIETHMSIEKLEEYFSTYDELTAKEITLIHMSDGNSNAEDFKRRIERVTGVPVVIA
ncbi:MBL fold metallo-hydrolase [Selenomonas sp. AB3002]|uniref:MBL fold metallo-hydrolase n=1 Tax=Selenomonas sp. AB3002 TaxID=1392502 RepID=UPI000496CE55